MLYRDKLVAAAAGMAVIVAGHASAQPQSNSLAPGIAPYAPPTAAGPTPPAPTRERPDRDVPGAASTQTESVASANAKANDPTKGYDYVLGAGDKVRIIVYGETDLTGEFFVAGNGDISFPLIGDVPASGQTLGKVRSEIESKLRDGYIKDPRVSAEILTFRPYYIYGEVEKPGEYPYSNGITVLNAIATAGGFTYRGNTKYVLLKHPEETKESKVRLTGDLKMAPGDSVRVMQRYF